MTYQVAYRVDGEPTETEMMSRESAIKTAMRLIAKVRPFADDDTFNECAVLDLEKGWPVCGVSLLIWK